MRLFITLLLILEISCILLIFINNNNQEDVICPSGKDLYKLEINPTYEGMSATFTKYIKKGDDNHFMIAKISPGEKEEWSCFYSSKGGPVAVLFEKIKSIMPQGKNWACYQQRCICRSNNEKDCAAQVKL